jgi:hypothetical protein
MVASKRTATIVLARKLRVYVPGERVRVIRGEYSGQIMTVREATNDYVALLECKKRCLMSRGIIEPENGFTEEEMNQADRVIRKGG